MASTVSIEGREQFQSFKGINHARNILREASERWNDRLVLEGNSYAECYARGRMALVVYLKLSPSASLEPVRILRKVGLPLCQENLSMLILKADVRESHYLENWNQQFMFVRDVHIVQGPEGPISSLVSLHVVDHEVPQADSTCMIDKFLLFQSAIYGTYKFFPRVSDWKARPVVSHSRYAIKSSVVQQIKSASHVMQRITNDEGSSGFRELSNENNENTVLPSVFLDSERVKIGSGKDRDKLIQVTDVLHGPFNLFP
ncbi:MAG: hypothetical protein WB421_07530 [Terriglobales bacterium]